MAVVVVMVMVKGFVALFSGQVKGCPRGVMVKAMDGEIVVSEFVLQSRHYVPFGQIPLEKV